MNAPAKSPGNVAEERAGERLAKRIARAGVCSRRAAEQLITQGRVTVNGAVIDSPAINVMPEDRVVVDGETVGPALPTRLFRYHKPSGLITSAHDERGRRTIFDALKDQLPQDVPRLMPVGRLDLTSEGLLLLTNDGGLKRHLELPKTGWVRRYRARVYGHLDSKALDALKNGITVDGVHYGAIDVEIEPGAKANRWLKIGLREGKNREIRRVLGHLGLEVSRLIRTAYGPFQLGQLKPGHVDEITGKVLREQLGKKYARTE